ncbi:fibronectin type III domain-containing protein [Longimicrobium sp.]|jgi:hypothetical protein|uniref:fibronectin type III domain-containing protein n=1 Tax=Longimicrobium sp. TaxID=2029185 RepID=UPI002ED9C704
MASPRSFRGITLALLAGILYGCDGTPPLTAIEPLSCDPEECADALEAVSAADRLTALLSDDGSRIHLAWPDTSSTETTFRVYRRVAAVDGSHPPFQVLADVPANSVGFADSVGLAPWTLYQYQVRPCHGTVCTAKMNSEIVTVARPPAGVEWARWAPTRVRLAWLWLPPGATHVDVERREWLGPGTVTEPKVIAQVPATATSHMDSVGVEPTGKYRYRLRACNGAACSLWVRTAYVLPGPVPAAPGSVYGAVARAGVIALAWTAGTGPAPRYYLVERRQRNGDGGYGEYQPLGELAAERLSLRDSAGLVSGETYEYRVSACGGGGCARRTSGDVALVVGPAPVAPGAIHAGPLGTSAHEVIVTWSDVSSDEASFRVVRSRDTGEGFGPFEPVAERSGNVTYHVDSVGASPWVAYRYRVQACNAGGCSTSPTSAVVTMSRLPVALHGTRYSPARNHVGWIRGSLALGQDRYEVQRRTADSGATFAPAGQVPGAPEGYPVERFVDTVGVAPGVSYEFRVRACNGSFCTAWSDPVVVEVPVAIPTSPVLRVQTVSPTALELVWTPGPTVPTYLRIARRQRGGDGTLGPVQATVEVPAEPAAYTDTGLTGGATYQYEVSTCNGLGCNTSLVEALVNAGPPAAPPALAINQYGVHTLQTSWEDVSDNEGLYRLTRRASTGSGFGAYSPVAELPRNSTSYTEQGLASWTAFQYQLRACNSVGCSAAVTSPPRTTAELRATYTRVAPTSVAVTWTINPTGGDRVEIQRRRRQEDGTYTAFEAVASVAPASGGYTDEGLTAGAQYRYQARACQGTVCTAFWPSTGPL